MVHHIVIIPAALSLLPLQGAAVGRAPSTLPIDRFCTRFSSFLIRHFFSCWYSGSDLFHFTGQDTKPLCVEDIQHLVARGALP